jgi:hypothetical protein
MRPRGTKLISVTTERTLVSLGVCAFFRERIKLTDTMNETDDGIGRRADMGHQNA